ncbi:MAG: hypothetical protein SVY53_10175 [Chloroflexota bacterium]|nr:hypothetical protein [Chloroflexota bacterium]
MNSVKEREQMKKDIAIGKRRCPSSPAYLPAPTKIIRYEEILMLTNGLYVDKYVPIRNSDEMHGLLISKRGNAQMHVGREFEPADQGHKVVLILYVDKQPYYRIDTGIHERMLSLAAVKTCTNDARVLVSTLGLGGTVVKLAYSNKPVSIHVCEPEHDVVRLVWPRLVAWCRQKGYRPKLSLQCCDVAKHLQQTKRRYDYIYLDIWPSPNEYNTLELKKLARKNLLPKGHIATIAARQALTPIDQGIGAFS